MKTSEYILAQYDLSGIQDYIFATNRLRENAGASANVGRILKKFLTDAIIRAVGEDKKKRAVLEWRDNQALQIEENPDILAEIVYIGGGNAEVLYRTVSLCNEAGRYLAMAAAEQCSGITVFSVCTKATGDYAEDSETLMREMGLTKRRACKEVHHSPYPIVEQDAFYGLPVTRQLRFEGGYSQNVSTVQYEKYNAFREGEEAFEGRKYAVEMEDIVRKRGENGYVAVVHIDGNGMGDLIREKMKACESYRDAVAERRSMSLEIEGLNEAAYQEMAAAVAESYGGKDKLPLRCLIREGDDLTFLCSADIGLPAVVKYLRCQLRLAKVPLPVSACAGIAFVHSHFPFRIAYQIAEECCANAKKSWYAAGEQKRETGYLDFHVVRGAYVRSMRELRQDEILRNRPFSVTKEISETPGSIDRFLRIRKKIAGGAADGKWPRNRLKRLYEACLKGPEAVKLLENEFSSRGYSVRELAAVSEGMDKAVKKDALIEPNGIFDALEIMDFYEKNAEKVFLDERRTGGRK